MFSSEDAGDMARGALDWLLANARDVDGGLGWASTPTDEDIDPTLYSGASGIVLALLEGHHHFGVDRYADAALRAARSIAAAVEHWQPSSLYFGLTGMAFALHTVGQQLGDGASIAARDRALELVRARFDGERWGEQFELLGGNAGVALGALAVGDVELATTAATPYLRLTEPTPGGLHWEVRTGVPARFHHISHGTLGIVYALAAIGAATGRADFTEPALAAAADVVHRDEAGPTGFLVPHSDPQHKPWLIERYSYGWCHGPAGDAQVFRLLGALTADPVWPALVDRCWHTVVHSGLPQRLRPGFWDNNGRCCGTAGVLALACDRYVEQRDGLDFAGVLVQDLAARTTVDSDGVRWSNYEHRSTPGELEPRTGWAMGNAGIIRELLRYNRVSSGGAGGYAVDWPDHPAAVPNQVVRASLRPGPPDQAT